MEVLIRRIIVCSLLVLGSSKALAGEVTGIVSDPEGAPFSGAPIQLLRKDSSRVYKTLSDPAGRYLISNVTPGEYEITVSMPCCAIAPFSNSELVVSDQPLRFDIGLKQGGSLNTLGDDPATIADVIRARSTNIEGAVPVAADGRPDLSGVWLLGHDSYPTDPELSDWAQVVVAERAKNDFFDHPHTRCLPAAPPIPAGGSPFIGKIVQTQDLVLILLEDYPGFRQIFVDGRQHPQDPNPSWMGHSIGRWEGNTLIADTVGFNDRGWLNGGVPITESTHMVERYTRTSKAKIELQVTWSDPRVFSAPWVQNLSLDLAPGEELIEYVCENNKWAPPAGS
jgi:hypothetical protein